MPQEKSAEASRDRYSCCPNCIEPARERQQNWRGVQECCSGLRQKSPRFSMWEGTEGEEFWAKRFRKEVWQIPISTIWEGLANPTAEA